MEEDKKIVVNLPEGATKSEIVIREGLAKKLLDPKPPVKINLTGVLNSPFEFLKKRIGDPEQIDPKRCHIIVNRNDISIMLIFNENDEYTRGQVIGKLEFHPKFLEFGINTGKVWNPTELGMFFKMNRAFFPDRQTNMKLVSELMNFSATVNNIIERSVKENGNKTDNFGQIVNSNLPESFTLKVPIFKGMKSESIEIETLAQVDGREVSFILFSPGANQTLEEIRDNVIYTQLSLIIEIAPDIAIIEQ